MRFWESPGRRASCGSRVPDLLGFDPDSVGLNFFYLVFSGAILVCPTAARMGAKPRDSRSGGEFLAALFADFLQVNVGAHLSRNR